MRQIETNEQLRMSEQKIKILVVDDTEAMRMLLRTRLERANFIVLEAPDGTTAIRIAVAEIPQLILCDLMMPDMNGYAVAQALKEKEATAKIPFLVMTASYNALSKQEGLTHGVTDILPKPTPFEDLLNIINTHVNKAVE